MGMFLEWEFNVRPIDGRDSQFFGFSHCIWPILPPTCQKCSANTDQKSHTYSAILHQKSCGKPNATTSYHLGMVNMPPIFDDFFKFGQVAWGWCSERKWRWSPSPRRQLWRPFLWRFWRTPSKAVSSSLTIFMGLLLGWNGPPYFLGLIWITSYRHQSVDPIYAMPCSHFCVGWNFTCSWFLEAPSVLDAHLTYFKTMWEFGCHSATSMPGLWFSGSSSGP